MPTYQQHKYAVREKEQTAARQSSEEKVLSRSSRPALHLPTLQELLHKLGVGLQKLFTALRFRFHQATGGTLSEVRLPWFKIALAAIAFFILTQKNIQFSINMKSPVSGFSDDREADGQAEQMSLAQPISLKTSAAQLPSLSQNQVLAYVERFGKVAQAEQDKYGIPASFKMAQAILESHAGLSEAAKSRHNHFGAPLANRIFDSAWENWRAHSLMLVRYFPELAGRQAPATDWAAALQQSDLVSDKSYAEKLMAVIHQYQLDKLD
ncbi:glucosaminidase domain-containing protein [Phaeodactylibacter xiamenensis]|uniref:glucosaminidase domain-containing protein n=1 Tax=Phaeodactylibacter xiamenensis TaxID=1524460 RepID=UPI003CCBB21D